jgi:hypothetical protein
VSGVDRRLQIWLISGAKPCAVRATLSLLVAGAWEDRVVANVEGNTVGAPLPDARPVLRGHRQCRLT